MTELIDDTLHMTHNFHPVQWDADPAEELLVAGKEGVFLFDRGADKWKRTQLVGNEAGETNFIGAGEIRTGKLPGGRRFLATVEPMHGNQAVTYTPPAPDSKRAIGHAMFSTTRLSMSMPVPAATSAGAGYDQVVVGWRAMAKPGVKVGIRLYVPLDKEGKTGSKPLSMITPWRARSLSGRFEW
jgi:hypothetical protein